MYDARGRSGAGQSGVLFGVITVAVIALAFFGILFMPKHASDSAPKVPGIAQVGSELLAVLDDSSTRKYVDALTRVSPRAADQLEADVSVALSDGADQSELAIIVMQSTQKDLIPEIKHLANADVRHFDGILKISETGLRKLSSAKSKWCKGATYEAFVDLGPARVEAMMRREFKYGSPAYMWAIEINTLMLEAVGDAKANPISHGTLTSSDERALQGLMMRMMSNPQIMQLMSMQGRDQAAMMRASRNLDICRLGVTGIDAVQSLPSATRGRMWSTAFRQMDTGDLQRAMNEISGF